MSHFSKVTSHNINNYVAIYSWTCPKEYCRLNVLQFPEVAQTYFGVRQECLRGLEGLEIHHKSKGGREDRIITCDPYGVNLIKATIRGAWWTYHHDEVNKQIHRIVKQLGMVNQLEIEDYFVHKLQGIATTPQDTVLFFSNHLKGFVPDGMQLGIACNKFPSGIDQFIEVKVIHKDTRKKEICYDTC